MQVELHESTFDITKHIGTIYNTVLIIVLKR